MATQRTITRLAGGRNEYDAEGVYGLTFGRDEMPELYDALLQRGYQEQTYGVPELSGRYIVLTGTIEELQRQIAEALGPDCLAIRTEFARINAIQVDEARLFVEIEHWRAQRITLWVTDALPEHYVAQDERGVRWLIPCAPMDSSVWARRRPYRGNYTLYRVCPEGVERFYQPAAVATDGC